MPTPTILALKYGIALLKIIYSITHNDHKGAFDQTLKSIEAKGGEQAKALATTRTTVASILESIARQLEKDRDWQGTDQEHEEAISEAAEILGNAFTFDTLAANLKTPQDLPAIWLRKRWAVASQPTTALEIRRQVLLKATAKALVTHITELPGFQNWYVGYMVQNFTEVLEKAQTQQEALSALGTDIRKLIGNQGVEDALFELRYREALIRYHNKVELFIEERRLDREYIEQTLSVAYVTLSLSHGRTEQQQSGSISADYLLDKRDPSTPNVFVIGKAGCGKTTLLRWLAIQSADYPNGNIFVASSRPQAVKPGALHKAGFAEYEIQELSTTGRIEFVNKWHEAVADRQGIKLADCQELLDMQQRILEAVKDNVSVRTLASNPLLCALMCALNRFYKEELPKDLNELCESACQMLLWDRDFRAGLAKGVCPPSYETLSKADRRHVVQRLAYDMVKESGATLPRSSALATISMALSRQPGDDERFTEEALEGLIQRSNLIRPADEDEIEFAHNILRDYMASSLFVTGNESKYLVKRLDDEGSQRWELIILFAVANETHKRFTEGLIEALLNKPVRLSKGRHLCRDLVVLKADARKQFVLSRDIQSQIHGIRQNIGTIDTPEKAIALAEAGELAVDFLKRHSGMTEAEEVACIHGLGRIDSVEAKEQLLHYLQKDASPAVLDALLHFCSPRQMAEVVNILRVPSIMLAVSTRQQELPVSYRPFICDLSPLQSLTELQYVNLSDTQVSDLSFLQNLTRLQTLYLHNTQVNDLSPLQSLTKLQFLILGHTQVSDLSPLQKLIELQVLVLPDSLVVNISYLKFINELQSLSLSGTQVSDLSPLQSLTKLQDLYLDGTQVSDLSFLQNLTGLQTLYLHNTQVNDLSPLQSLTKLQFLSLGRTQVSDLSPLQSLTALETLDLAGTQVTNLSPLQNLTALKRLDLSNTHVSDLSPLQNLTGLLYLDLTGTQVRNLSPLKNITGLEIVRRGDPLS